MKIVVEIGHPENVHVFKNAIYELQSRGHIIKIVARNKDVSIKLLQAYELDFTSISNPGKNLIGLMAEMLIRDWRMFFLARSFQPDIFLSESGTSSAHIAYLTGKVSITLDDTEHARLERSTWLPFTTKVFTPESFTIDLGRKQVRYKGCQKLAYLHPNRFKPNPKVIKEIGLSPNDKYFIIRFVNWKASHDIGYHGFSYEGKKRLIAELEKQGRVFITSEAKLPKEFESYQINISPTKILDLLAYATLYIGEGASMASEAALLGVPSIYFGPFRLGYIEEEERGGLVYRYVNEEKAIERAISLVKKQNILAEWQKKRQLFLKNKIDVTAWLVDFIENFRG